MTKPKLKPCPFCGAKPRDYEYNEEGEFILAHVYHRAKCFLIPSGIYWDTISAWNLRASSGRGRGK